MSRTRSKAPSEAVPALATSTATAFLDGTAEKIKKQQEEKRQAEFQELKQLSEQPKEDDDPSQYGFPFNYIYGVQDYLNDNMTTRAFVQLLVVAYTANLIFINHYDFFMAKYELVLYNLVGVSLATLLTYNTMNKKHLSSPEIIPKPELPEFNYLHAIFVPAMFSLFSDPENVLLNLSLNYFVVTGLPLFARLVCAFMFYYVYTDEATIPFRAIQTFAAYVSINYLLDFINTGSEATTSEIPSELKQEDNEELEKLTSNTIGSGKSLLPSEVHFLTLFLVKALITVYPHSAKLTENVYIPLIIFQKLLLSAIGAAAANYPLLKYCQSKKIDEIENFTQDPTILSGMVVVFFSTIFYLLTNYQLEDLLEGRQPVVWLYEYIMESEERIRLLSIWLGVLVVSILVVFVASVSVSLNYRRKIWHSVILLVLTISQPLITQPIFTLIALGGAIIIFILVEMLRYNKFTFVGELLYKQLIVFQDSKDLKGPLNCSYIFLLFGILIPFVVDFYEHQGLAISKFSYLGLVFLGVGDSFASIVGKSFGTIKWSGSYKTIQGTAAFLVSTFAAFYALDAYLGVTIESWENIFVTCLLAALLEGASDMNDNFLLPCFSYVVLKALEK